MPRDPRFRMSEGHTQGSRPERKQRFSDRRRRGDETRSVWKRCIRLVTVSWLRGIAAEAHTQGRARESQTRRHGPSARQEVDQRQVDRKTHRLRSPRGLRRSNAGSRPGSCVSKADEPGASDTQRVHAKSHRLQISSSKYRAFPTRIREALGARGPRSRATTCGKNCRAPKSVPRSRRTP
jgi:hypothetical protein